MPHADHRQILCGMKGPPDPQHRPAALDEFGLVATGITALVAKRILEKVRTVEPVEEGRRRVQRPSQGRP
jgi:hypothetical protein